MSSSIFKRARIAVPLCLLLVLIAVFSFLMMPGISAGRPNVITLAATDIGVTTATLHGTYPQPTSIFSGNRVFANGHAAVGFAWGTSQGGPYPNTIPGIYDSEMGVNFHANLTNLLPFTTYYYCAFQVLDTSVPGAQKVYAQNPMEPIAYGNEVSFTTLGNMPSGNPLTSGDAGTTIGIPADVQFNYVYLSPAVASAGQPVKVVANVVNRGSLEGGYTANLQINGHIEQTKMGTVAGNTYVPVEFTVMKDTPGTYSVDIGGQTTTFTVVAAETSGGNPVSQSQIFTIVLAILGVAAIGLLTAVIMRRRSGY
jgi:hypothetical protein